MDILMIGHVTKDLLIHNGTVEIRAGGAVYYGAIALSRRGVHVGVVTRLAPSDVNLLADLNILMRLHRQSPIML
ncbi:MAG: hypothetical protein HY783_09500 [Chloroflexi bacterium]|nr:hypothetical protein [Chloroflexota bacterium]